MVRGISHLHLCTTLPGNKIKHPIGHRDIKSSNIILGGSCVRGSIMVNQWPFLTAVWFPSVNAQTNFCCCNWPIRSLSAADAMWFSHIVAWTIFLELTHFYCYLYIFFNLALTMWWQQKEILFRNMSYCCYFIDEDCQAKIADFNLAKILNTSTLNKDEDLQRVSVAIGLWSTAISITSSATITCTTPLLVPLLLLLLVLLSLVLLPLLLLLLLLLLPPPPPPLLLLLFLLLLLRALLSVAATVLPHTCLSNFRCFSFVAFYSTVAVLSKQQLDIF